MVECSFILFLRSANYEQTPPAIRLIAKNEVGILRDVKRSRI